MPLSDLASRSIKARSMTRLSQEELGKLRDVLKGMKVDVRLPGHIGKKPKKIMKILVDVGRIQFEKDGQPVTVHVSHRHLEGVVDPKSNIGPFQENPRLRNPSRQPWRRPRESGRFSISSLLYG